MWPRRLSSSVVRWSGQFKKVLQSDRTEAALQESLFLFDTMWRMQGEWLIGVDEAGRGPLAGPVSVGVVPVPLGFDIKREFKGVTDSKLLNRQKRETIFVEAE